MTLNTVKEKCKGEWTRLQREEKEKSLIDYVLTNSTNTDAVKETKIDKEK